MLHVLYINILITCPPSLWFVSGTSVKCPRYASFTLHVCHRNNLKECSKTRPFVGRLGLFAWMYEQTSRHWPQLLAANTALSETGTKTLSSCTEDVIYVTRQPAQGAQGLVLFYSIWTFVNVKTSYCPHVVPLVYVSLFKGAPVIRKSDRVTLF